MKQTAAPVLVAVLMLIAVIARLLPGARTIDDAFITFRYSQNLIDGAGFVYNPGVQTLGTTTPLFAVIMAGIGVITGGRDFQITAILVSAAADALTVALLFLIARRWMGHIVPALVPALLWAISPMSVTFAIGGMETSLNILWMVAATWLYVSANPRPIAEIGIGVCAALGLLTRADAALWIVPLFAYQLIERLNSRSAGDHDKRSLRSLLPIRTWAAAAAILIPWIVFATVYFGTPIPNSVTAKRFAYVIEPNAGLIKFIQTYATPFFEFDTFGSTGALVGSIAYLLLSGVGLLAAVRRLPRLLPFLAYAWIYFAVFAALNPLIFRWYLAPPLPALMLGIIGGLWAIFTRPAPRPDQAPRAVRAPIFALIVISVSALVWTFTSINGWTLHPDHGLDRPAPRMAWHEIEILYQRMGTLLRDEYNITADTRVASADIGAVGFFSRAVIVDTVGLVTPELTRYTPVNTALIAEGQNYAIPPQLIYDTQPEYLITMEGFIREGLAVDPQFAAEYNLIESFPTDFYGTAMQLYRRRP